MANISNYGANTLVLPYFFRTTAPTRPAALYVALCTTTPVASDTGTNLTSGTGGTGIEVTGNAYTRMAWSPSDTNWSAPSGGSTSNSGVIQFPTATGTWGTINGWAICDASTNGNMIFFGSLTTPKTVNNGDIATFQASSLTMSVS